MYQHLCGFIPDESAVAEFCKTQAMPLFTGGAPRGNKPVLLYEFYRHIAGEDDLGAQGIGDCVSWGFKHLVDFGSCVEIYREIEELSKKYEFNDPKLKLEIDAKLYGFQMSSSEVIYGLSRVEIGGQRRSFSDGSRGPWGAQAIYKYGTISYRKLKELGHGDKYDPRRAKEWGAYGLPDNLEPTAAQHKVETISLVTNFNDYAHLCESGYGTAICSNMGFENGPRGVTLRDAQGFATPRRNWSHCMFLAGVRYDRPGALCINQWPLGAFAGPLVLNQPKNSFWIDEKYVNEILAQRESWTASGHKGYPLRRLDYKF